MEPEDYATLALLSAIWGASFLFIKVGVREMPPVWVSGVRTLCGALALLPVLLFSKIPLAQIRRYWKPGLVVALFNAALPYTLFALGETKIDSSLAGILNATLPAWTVLMVPLWHEAEPVGLRQVAGVVLGFGGAMILARPSAGIFSGSALGVGLCVAATLSYAFSSHFSRRAFQRVAPQLTAFMQCLGAAALLLPLEIIFHPRTVPSAAAFLAVAALGVGGTGVAMVLAYRLIKRVGASRTSVVTYTLPPFALFWGSVVLGERPDVSAAAALVLILGGVYLITAARPRTVPARPLVDEAAAEA